MGYGSREQSGGIIEVNPRPNLPLWRPPVRPLAQANRDSDFATLGQLSSVINPKQMTGYTNNLDGRFRQLHNHICNMYVAGAINGAPRSERQRWTTIVESFRRVFSKQLTGEYTSKGGRVGIRLSNGSLTKFATLSTGELEFLSLLCDVLDDPEVDLLLIDEIDAHFHPDLQRRVIDEIKPHCANRYVLLSSQSPAVMLSVPTSQLFFIRHNSEVPEGKNQVTRLDSDYGLLSSLTEMYAGFSSDLRLVNTFSQAATHDLIKYAEECLTESEVVAHGKARDDEPQVASLRGSLLHVPSNATICEVGVGQGRLLRAYEKLDPSWRAQIEFVATDIHQSNLESVAQLEASLKLNFKSFKTQHVDEELPESDLFVLANVIHEVGPDNLADFMNRILRRTRPDGRILLLEALELAVGERRFVLFDGASLATLFQREVAVRHVELRFANPNSYSQLPLLEAVLLVKQPEECHITTQDVVNALVTVQLQAAAKLDLMVDEQTNAKSRVLAFHAHNLANSKTFEIRLRRLAQAEMGRGSS